MDNAIYTEENNVYQIDCSKALWSSDCIHEVYHQSNVQLSDVDFIIEDENKIMLVEYKNANIPNAVNPGGFNPCEDKKINSILRKYYDSLHYLGLVEKTKPKEYIYILEYPNGDSTSRRMLRNRIKPYLPFNLQNNMHKPEKMISKFSILSIEEWNNDEIYRNYPITKCEEVQSQQNNT